MLYRAMIATRVARRIINRIGRMDEWGRTARLTCAATSRRSRLQDRSAHTWTPAEQQQTSLMSLRVSVDTLMQPPADAGREGKGRTMDSTRQPCTGGDHLGWLLRGAGRWPFAAQSATPQPSAAATAASQPLGVERRADETTTNRAHRLALWCGRAHTQAWARWYSTAGRFSFGQ